MLQNSEFHAMFHIKLNKIEPGHTHRHKLHYKHIQQMIRKCTINYTVNRRLFSLAQIDTFNNNKSKLVPIKRATESV